MSGSGSVFLGALGERGTASLHPEVLAYAAGAGADTAGAQRIVGVFEAVGSPWAPLLRLARPLLGPGALIARRGRNVSFVLTNRFGAGDGGAGGEPALRATRSLRFPGGTEVFSDLLTPGPRPGTLRNRLGERGRVELLLRCEASPEGGFRMRSLAARLRLGREGRIRIPLPRLLGVEADLAQGFDEVTGRHWIDARARNPLLGTVLDPSLIHIRSRRRHAGGWVAVGAPVGTKNNTNEACGLSGNAWTHGP
ncbi:DUF4166 domain-containing protein [Leucobacter massiliensis]|uniref:DUF4166 domain-containing protein n=1 Tax=Leucobacter massiliensis TaxID=1686285 RepID=UPI0015E47CC3|nr:DUF4166 domain-containing protein [Leucobacter massiliensis]